MRGAKTQRFGDIVVDKGLLSRSTLETSATRARSKLGEYLRAHGLLSSRHVAQCLAAQQQLVFVNFAHHPPDARLFNPSDWAHYGHHHYVPYARARDGLIVATPSPSAALQKLLEAYYRVPIALVVTGPRDIRDYCSSVAATTSTRHARLSLRRKYRHLVADRTMTPEQTRGLTIGSGLLLAAALLAPQTSWQTLLFACNLFYLASIVVKLHFYRHGCVQLRTQRAALPTIRAEAAALSDAALPVYSVLVPLYRESGDVMKRLIESLSALDYPREKLDIKLICEADDANTITTLKTLRPPEIFEILTVPPSSPRTKPKACNVALQQIRGEFLVIYDAEDIPAPDQLRRAALLFQRGSARLACLQGRLNYYNRNENLLTQLFAIEYSTLFRISLPALERLRMPIPLGGTSNHLRVAALVDAGGWDAFNVTEDADLGIRLAYLGYETRMLPSLTLEEAPINLRAWLNQRTRWIKGYIQTWLVYMRHPAELKKRLGSVGYYGFQFFVGVPALTFLLAPIFWGIFVISLTGYITRPASPLLYTLCMLSFLGGIFSNWLYARATLYIEGWRGMERAFALYPFYWLLHSVAAARALYQLATNPHYWNKTTHGVSSVYASWVKRPNGLDSAQVEAKLAA